MKLIALLLLWEVALLLITIVNTSFDYTSPTFISLTMFILSTMSYVLNFDRWDVTFYDETLIVMVFGLTTMVLVESLVKSYYDKKNNGFCVVEYEKAWINNGTMKFFILVSSLMMMLIYILDVNRIGARINISDMISVIGAVKQSEYHTGFIATICLRVGYALSNVYGFIFCHNTIISKQKLHKNLYLLLSMLAGIISSFYSGSRGMMLGTIFGFIFYLIVCSRINKGWKEIKLRKNMKYIIPAIISFFLIFFISRNVVKNRQYSSSLFEYITYYLGNSQQLLNLALKDTKIPFPIESNLPGLYSFQFLYNELSNLKLVSIPSHISSQFMHLGGGITQRGNVYTIFGEPYHDFGFVGMLLYVSTFFYFFCYFYYKYIRYWNNTKKNKRVLLVFGSQYYLIFFTFYLAPTIWIKVQTLVTILISIIVYTIVTKYKFVLRK